MCPWSFGQDLDATVSICVRALEGSTEKVRASIAEFLGSLLVSLQQTSPHKVKGKVSMLMYTKCVYMYCMYICTDMCYVITYYM